MPTKLIMKKLLSFVIVVFFSLHPASAQTNTDSIRNYKKRVRAVTFANNYVRIEDVKKNTLAKDYHKILILGAGTSVVRLVLEKLYENLSVGLLTKKIETDYCFLGNDKEEVNKKYKEILRKKDFDACLVFIQNNPSLINETYIFRELPRAYARLNQSIAIGLFESNDASNSVWEAIMEINFVLTHDKNYKTISTQIIKEMKDNLLCN